MRSRRIMQLAAGTVGALLAVGVGVSASQARDATPSDPELRVHHHPARTVAAAFPSTINSDVYVYASSPTSRLYFTVAGHLRLSLAKGSTTKYGGTLVDYSGNTVFKAAASVADPNSPRLAFKSTNGAFRITADKYFGSASYSGTATLVPKTLGVPAKSVTFSGSAHKATAATHGFTLTERVGPAQPHFEYTGTITVVHDANDRISGGQVTVEDAKGRQVTHALRASGYYSSSYFYTGALLDKQYFSLNATFSGTSFSGFGFTGTGATASQWVLSGGPPA